MLVLEMRPLSAMFLGLLLGLVGPSTATSLHGGKQDSVVLSGESTPKQLLCGESVPAWCSQWVDCIHDCAVPESTPAKVKSCWDPAPCQEYCGVWPVSGTYCLACAGTSKLDK